MRSQLKRTIAAIGPAVALAALWSVSVTQPVIGQGTSLPANYKAPRAPGSTTAPDLNGFWQGLNSANWDVEAHSAAPSPFPAIEGAWFAQPAGLSIVEGDTIPYKPEALARRNKHRQMRLSPDPLLQEEGPGFGRFDSSDPEAKCFQSGVPRGAYIGFPFQIVQTPTKILIAHEYAGSARTIHMDIPRTTLLDIESWSGQSVGSWEGDTLVVDVQWFSGGEVWLDRSGNYYSGQAKIVERYTPISPYHLMYEATITDPDTFTRPWKLSMPLYRRVDKNMQLLEFQCIPFGEEYHYKTLVKGYKPPAK